MQIYDQVIISTEQEIEQMKLRSEDQEWLKTEIDNRIFKFVDQFNPHGLKKLAHWLREWGIVGTNITIIFALLAMTLTAAYYAFSRVSKEAAFEANTGTRLETIEATLKLIPAQIAAARYSSVPPKELKAHRDELAELKRTLTSIPRSTPNFWSTSFQVITLLSRTISDVEPSSKPETDLNNVSGVILGQNIVVPGTRVLLRNRIANSVFRGAVVRFDPSVRLENVTFINCILIFPEGQQPSGPLENIGNALLMASDLSHVVISGS